MPTVTVATAGEQISVDYQPGPDFSDLPMVKYGTLHKTGDTATTVLGKRVTTRCYVDMTDVDAELVDFAQSGYSLLAPNVAGLYSPDPDRARLTLRRMSSTKAATVPPQSTKGSNPLTVARFGPNNSSSGIVTKLYGLTLAGSDQPDAFGHPHNYSGLVNYWGRRAEWATLRLIGLGRGDWNSPPGETFQLNNYNDAGTTLRGIEVDGRDAASGEWVGGGIGFNGSQDLLVEDCSFHDSLVSGLTFGTAGSVQTGRQCRNITTRRVKVAHNARHSTAPGQGFTGINHEGVEDSVRHEQPDIWMDRQDVDPYHHFFFASAQTDTADIAIIDPVWHGEAGGSPGWARGCLVICVPDNYAGAPNKQASLPTVTLHGVTLTPVGRAAAATADPGRNYIRTR